MYLSPPPQLFSREPVFTSILGFILCLFWEKMLGDSQQQQLFIWLIAFLSPSQQCYNTEQNTACVCVHAMFVQLISHWHY